MDSLNRTIDSLQYFTSWGGSTGKSLERINVEHSSTDSSNWKTSQSNIRPLRVILTLFLQRISIFKSLTLYLIHVYPFFGDNVSVAARVKNKGTSSANFNLQLWEDTNLDSLPNTLVSSLEGINLLPGDSVNALFSLSYNQFAK